jgi:hypothetical protein
MTMSQRGAVALKSIVCDSVHSTAAVEAPEELHNRRMQSMLKPRWVNPLHSIKPKPSSD